MSYFDIGNTELVARQGYSGTGLGIDWSDVTGLAKGALNFYGESQQAAGRAAAATEIAKAQAAARQAQTGTPKWVMPVAIGGAALLAVVLLRKKK